MTTEDFQKLQIENLKLKQEILHLQMPDVEKINLRIKVGRLQSEIDQLMSLNQSLETQNRILKSLQS